MKSNVMKQTAMKESSRSGGSTSPHLSHGKISSGHGRKKGGSSMSSTTKRLSVAKRESRNESSKPMSTRKASEKRVVWSKVQTDREFEIYRPNDNRHGDAKPSLKPAPVLKSTVSLKEQSNGHSENTKLEGKEDSPSSSSTVASDNVKSGKSRSLFSRFKKKKSHEEADDGNWQDFIQIVPATDGMKDATEDIVDGNRNSINPTPEGRDDGDHVDRSVRGSSHRYEIEHDDTRNRKGKTRNQKDGSDDGSRNSNMEFSTGDLSDLSFPAVGDASLEKRLSTVLGGKLGLGDEKKKTGFRNLVSTKSQNKKKGESTLQGLVPWSKQRSEEKQKTEEKQRTEKKQKTEEVKDLTTKTKDVIISEKAPSFESKQPVAPIPVEYTETTKPSSLSKDSSSPPVVESKNSSSTKALSSNVSTGKELLVKKTNPTRESKFNFWPPIQPSTETTAKPFSMETPSKDRNVSIGEDKPSSTDKNEDPSQEEIIESTDVDKGAQVDGCLLENFEAPACSAPSFTFLPEDNIEEIPVDCDCASGLADALNYVTAPLFQFLFGESSTVDPNQNRASEEEKKDLLEIVTSDKASKEDKERALSRLRDLIENQEMSIDELPEVIYRNSFDQDSNVSGETGITDGTDDATSVTKSIESLPGESRTSRWKRIKRRRESRDRYTPMVTGEETSVTPTGDGEPDACKSTGSPDAVEGSIGREVEPEGDWSPPSTEKAESIASSPSSSSISPAELKILKKHAMILGIDVNVLINARNEGQTI